MAETPSRPRNNSNATDFSYFTAGTMVSHLAVVLPASMLLELTSERVLTRSS